MHAIEAKTINPRMRMSTTSGVIALSLPGPAGHRKPEIRQRVECAVLARVSTWLPLGHGSGEPSIPTSPGPLRIPAQSLPLRHEVLPLRKPRQSEQVGAFRSLDRLFGCLKPQRDT